MDFLKTLLAYMALMAALGVQEGPAIDTVPTPTPLPPTVTATLVPHQTETPTATPSPKPEPKPTITPNYRYETIDFGDSGSSVRKLQKKLIDLGYMPKGSDDSQYGYQTYNAVKAFQKANGLSADGVAGPATLTTLYEDPNVIGVVEPTVVPTASPTPTMPPIPTPPPATETPEPLPLPTVNAPDGWDRLDDGAIISGNTGKPLYLPGEGQTAPDLFMTADGRGAVSLQQLADCLENWQLEAASADLWKLTACGYAVEINLMADGLNVTVDGTPVALDMQSVQLHEGTLYVTDAFLTGALGAQVVFDVDENSLVLFLVDKSLAGAQD